MTNSDDVNRSHLSRDLLVRFIDGEACQKEAEQVQAHFRTCQSCRSNFQALTALSADLESVVTAAWPQDATVRRDALVKELDRREIRCRSTPSSESLLRFSWSLGIAAMLALAVLVLTGRKWGDSPNSSAHATGSSANLIEFDGETFVSLPYSNPDLAMSGPHVVQMEMPASSLTEAGVVFEPVSSQSEISDRSVLADVLLGADGQPLGVHVLSAE
jgi:hypothetical protein